MFYELPQFRPCLDLLEFHQVFFLPLKLGNGYRVTDDFILQLGVDGIQFLDNLYIHVDCVTGKLSDSHGIAWGLRGPFMQALRADYFGRASIGMILGLSYMIIVLGQVGGPMIAGILADATGDYRVGFTTLALLAGVGSLFFVFAKKPAKPARGTLSASDSPRASAARP